MKLESSKKIVQKSAEHIFNAISDVKRFESLMPENVAKFEVLSDDSFVFGLKGMPEIKLKFIEKTPINKVVLGAAGGPIPFALTANIKEISENSSEIFLNFDGEINAMMAMMVKAPLTKFLETLVENADKL